MKLKYISLITLLIFSVSSCKDYLDVNTDPNNPVDASIDLILPVGMASVGIQVGGSYQNLGGFWAQYYTQSPDAGQYENIDEYNITSDYYDREWTDIYAGGINDLQVVRNKAQEAEDGSYYLVATCMQAYAYQFLADAYGDIPYSEALKGLDGNFNPAFDKGADVYKGLLSTLDAAVAYYNDNPGTGPANDDLVYGGNMAQWVGFANSLKLRMLMRASGTSMANAAAVKALLAADNFITSDAMMTQFANEEGKRNPYYEIQVDRLGGVNQMASNTMIKMLVDNNDPRLDALYVQGSTGQWVAKEQGDFANRDIPFGELASPMYGANTPVYFITVAEVNFLKAEAQLKYEGGTGTQASYEAGVQASFDRLGVSGASTLLGSGGDYEFNTGGTEAEKMQQIMTQKWISMTNAQNLEAFFEINRTGYPEYAPADSIGIPGALTISIGSVLPKGVGPQRLLYPDVEKARNTKVPVQPGGGIGAKLWWAKQ